MPRLSSFDDVGAFRERVEPHLLSSEAGNNLLFGILHGIARERYAEYVLTSLEDDGAVALAAVMTPPFNIVLSRASEAATRALAEMLPHPVPGVSAEAGQARVFAEVWAARTGSAYRRTMSQRIYALTTLRQPADVAGAGRTATSGDRPLVRAWMRAFEREALPPDDANAAMLEQRIDWFLLPGDDAELIVWEDGGKPVSMAGRSGPTPNGMRIGPVYTPPELRGRGYAAACTAEASARVLASGRSFCFLYTDLTNPTSNGVYGRIGYEPVCDAAVYRFTQS